MIEILRSRLFIRIKTTDTEDESTLLGVPVSNEAAVLSCIDGFTIGTHRYARQEAIVEQDNKKSDVQTRTGFCSSAYDETDVLNLHYVAASILGGWSRVAEKRRTLVYVPATAPSMVRKSGSLRQESESAVLLLDWLVWRVTAKKEKAQELSTAAMSRLELHCLQRHLRHLLEVVLPMHIIDEQQ